MITLGSERVNRVKNEEERKQNNTGTGDTKTLIPNRGEGRGGGYGEEVGRLVLTRQKEGETIATVTTYFELTTRGICRRKAH